MELEQHEKDTDQTYSAISIAQLSTMELPPREYIVEPWLRLKGLVMVYANRGVGKTYFALELALAAASGVPFLGWKVPKAHTVAYLDGEMSLQEMQERSKGMCARFPVEAMENLQLINQETQKEGMPNLSDAVSQARLSRLLDELGVDLIVLDNLSTLCRSGIENEAESWTPVQNWLLRQRAAGRSVLMVHHAGKSGQQRGTSKREDILDTVVALKRPNDYTPVQGARFEVHFEKARGFSGSDAEPMVAQLRESDGQYTWQVDPLEATRYEQAVALLNEGVARNEICEQLNVTKGTVSKYAKRASGEGLLNGEDFD